MIKFVEDEAAHNTFKVEAATEFNTIALSAKMDVVAWTIRAVPFLQDKSISELLNIYRATEIPLEPTMLQAYRHA